MNKYSKKRYKKKNKKRFLIASCLLIISFLSLKYIKSDFILFKVSKDVIFKIDNFLFKPFIKEKEIVKDNNSLEAELENLKYENNILKDSLYLKYDDYSIINATVTYRNPNYWINNLTIDKGKSSGIEDNMAVITGECLIGRVSAVLNDSSTITLITSSNNTISVGVKGKDGYNHGLISGYDYVNDLIIVSGITSYDEVYVNSKVVTTGINNKMPSGLLIGYVTKIEDNKYNISKKVYVKSNCNLNDIRYVGVLKK